MKSEKVNFEEIEPEDLESEELELNFDESQIPDGDLKRAQKMMKAIEKGTLSVQEIDDAGDLILLNAIVEKELDILQKKVEQIIKERQKSSDS